MKRSMLAMLFWVLAGSAAAQDSLMPADAKIEGMTQGELSVRWWQWAGSFRYADSPVADRTGEKCGAGQDGPIWFLAGTYGSSVTKRTCRVPSEKYLFFPIINYVVTPNPSCPGCLDCRGATASAKETTDNPTVLFAELDGQSLGNLKNRRYASPACFNLAGKIFGSAAIEPSAANGYYLLLKPLAKGTHTLRFGAELPSLRQGLDYTLIVE